MATPTAEALKEWNLKDRVKAMSFDKTASNTGKRLGAAYLIQHIGKDLLHLASRHHMHKVVLSDVFSQVMGSSSVLKIQMFKRFKNARPFIVSDRITDAKTDEETVAILSKKSHWKDETVQFVKVVFLQTHLEVTQRNPGASPHLLRRSSSSRRRLVQRP